MDLPSLNGIFSIILENYRDITPKISIRGHAMKADPIYSLEPNKLSTKWACKVILLISTAYGHKHENTIIWADTFNY